MDARNRQHLDTDEITVGDNVLTGGELPALLLTDADARAVCEWTERERTTLGR